MKPTRASLHMRPACYVCPRSGETMGLVYRVGKIPVCAFCYDLFQASPAFLGKTIGG